MKIVLAILIGLMFSLTAVSGRFSSSAVSVRGPGPAPLTGATPLPKDGARKPMQLQLKLSASDPTCVKSASCKLLLDIYNLSDRDVDTEASMGLLLSPVNIPSSSSLVAPLNATTLEPLGPNQFGKFEIKTGQHIEKELDLAKIKWHKMEQSSWAFYDLRQEAAEGKYRVSLTLAENPKLFPPKPVKVDEKATKAIGRKDVVIVNAEPGPRGVSNSLTLDFKEK
jgi:hypothetical protein